MLLGVYFTAPAAAQQPIPADSAPISSPPASLAPDSPPPPVPPTPAQQRYLEGLRTAARGIAQIKDGLSRLARTQTAHDTLRTRQAGKRLGGLCGAARGFMVSGRAQMQPAVYEPPTRKPAWALTVRLDSLSAYASTCQQSAGKTPTPVATELLDRIRKYELALANFRSAIGLPNR